MESLTILDQIRIASPCDARWEEMTGDDRSRLCARCSKPVYSIAAMTAAEATALIRGSERIPCLQIWRRKDGTILTADCPVGQKARRASRLRRVAVAVVFGVVASATSVVAASLSRRSVEPPPSGPGVMLDDWADWAMVTLGIRGPRPLSTRGMVLLGEPAMIRPVPPTLPGPNPLNDPGEEETLVDF
jgi:hypothetical protein